jgi:glycolate oxidase FAD binding subunit
MLAFEPADSGPLLGEGGRGGRGTSIGGVLACNLSGPRRIKAGAARDHFLGFQAVSGRGEEFKSGGRWSRTSPATTSRKLLSGSHGTLAVMTEVTRQGAAAPETTRTVLVFGLDDATAAALPR